MTNPPTLPRASIMSYVVAEFVVDLSINRTLHIDKRPICTNNDTAISAKYYHSLTIKDAFSLLDCWFNIDPYRLTFSKDSFLFSCHRGSFYVSASLLSTPQIYKITDTDTVGRNL